MGEKSALEESLALLIADGGLPAPVRQHRFCERKWKFDFAWPDLMVAVEVDGGTYSRGRHTRPTGYRHDCDKLNRAALEGWRVLRFTSDHIRYGEALPAIEKMLHKYAGAP